MNGVTKADIIMGSRIFSRSVKVIQSPESKKYITTPFILIAYFKNLIILIHISQAKK